MFKVPANWRPVQVTHPGTGETETLEFRVVGIGGGFATTPSPIEIVGGGVNEATAHNMIWGSTWWNAPAPCTRLGATVSVQWFFWRTPVEAACAKPAQYLIPSIQYGDLSFAYELRTPNPLRMSAGQYLGSLTLGVGPGQDFDFGDVVIASDSALTLNFELEVDHALKIEVPPGGNKVLLEPQGGWQAWLNQGRKPTRLFRDQTFHISTSSRFKMGLECQYAGAGNTCSVWEPDSDLLVPVEISVSLPHGLTDAAGQSVNRRRLYRDGSGTELFQPGHHMVRKPGTLHFEIVRDQVEEMLKAGGDKTYTGDVTVLWDSDI